MLLEQLLGGKQQKMGDLNFLNSHIDIRKTLINKYMNVMIALTVIAVMFLGVFLWNIYRMHSLNSQINTAQNFLKSSDNLQKLKTYRDAVNKTDALKKYYDEINNINENLDNVSGINSSLLEKISGIIPEDTFIQNMSISSSGIDISGNSEIRVSIAEFQHNLKQLDIFKDVFISIINKEANVKVGYSFTLRCELKGVK